MSHFTCIELGCPAAKTGNAVHCAAYKDCPYAKMLAGQTPTGRKESEPQIQNLKENN